MRKWGIGLCFLMAAILIGVVYSCSKEEPAANNEKGERVLKSAANCEQCVNTWLDSKETFTLVTKEDDKSVYLDVNNDSTRVYYKVYRNVGTIGNIQIDNGSNLGFSPAVTFYEFSKPITGFSACSEKTVLFNKIGGLGGAGGSATNLPNSFYLRQLCTATTLKADPASDFCVGSPVVLTAEVSAGNNITGGTLKILKGTTVVAAVSVATSKTLQFTYTPQEAGTAIFTAVYDASAAFKSSSSAALSVEAVNCGCKTEFVGKAISCGAEREVEFTFTNNGELGYVKIQGGLTNFSDGDAVITLNGQTSLTGYTISQRTPGGSSNRIITIEGPASCEKLVINIKWDSTNKGEIITGDWTVEGDGIKLSQAGLSCSE